MSTEENLYKKLNASELSAIILKGSPTSQHDRDAGFCSGSSEGGDDLSMDHSRLEPRSPTDASEDSVEVKVTPISLPRNKRKSTEPSRVICEQESGPLKKRIRYASGEINCGGSGGSSGSNNGCIGGITIDSKNHFRPWSRNNNNNNNNSNNNVLPHEIMPNPAEILIRHPGVTTLHRKPAEYNDIQEEPLALVAKKSSSSSNNLNYTSTDVRGSKSTSTSTSTSITAATMTSCESTNNINHLNNSVLLNLIHSNDDDGGVDGDGDGDADGDGDGGVDCCGGDSLDLSSLTVHSNAVPNNANSMSSSSSTCSQRPQQRNYKNMTRERRIEANARERTRVHTISAAYDTLRKSIPSYSHTQKLSKLSVLRVACSYILTLSRMAGFDYSEDESAPSIASCFEMVTKTIQTEGKIRKKKDE